MSYDRHNSKHSRIYRVNTERNDTDDPINLFATAPLPLAPTLTEEYSGVKNAVRIRRGFGNGWIDIGNDVNIPLGGFFADNGFMQMFEYELEYGNPATALVEPNSVVLTKQAAKKLYDIENPIGELIKVGELGEYKVTGVLKKTDTKSHIKFEALASLSSLKALEADSTFRSSLNNWEDGTAGWVYIEMNEGTSPQVIENQLGAIADDVYSDIEDLGYRFELQNLTAITPGPLLGNQIGPSLPNIFVYFLAVLALIIMLSACFNYTNLTIARSLTRAKEIGVRKVSGAYNRQIFTQFITEAVVISVSALIIALLLLVGLKPAFQNLQFASLLQWKLSATPFVYAVCIVFSLFVGIMAGLFPALLLSSFQPIKVLGSLSGMKLFSKTGLRKALIVAQFTLSLVFIISTILVYQQLNFMVNADYGFNKENVINVPINNTDYELLKAELQNYSSIENVAMASHIPAAGMTYGTSMRSTLEDEELDLSYFAVDEDYIENMELSLVAGRNFDGKAANNIEQHIIVNEAATRNLGYDIPQDAIGQTIYIEDSTAVEVIGIVADYNHQTLVSEIGSMALRNTNDRAGNLQVKHTEGNYDQALFDIQEAWGKINPELKMDHSKFEDDLTMFYDLMFGDLVNIVGVFAFIAITVACLGLLGMATFTTETRLKEVSIRKVLGAEDKNVIMLLSKGFLIMLGIAILLAVPASYLLNSLWLDLIAYRIDISPLTLAMSTLIILGLGALTIGSQTYKAATVNPAESLKME